MSEYFLRKDKEDVAQEIITFLKGLVSNLVQSSDFSTGELGSGFVLRNDGEGSYLEIDRLLVRRVAYFVELIIKSLKHVGGTIVLTPASMRCSRVEEFDAFYRCYFENERDGKTISQEFVAGDQARAQSFNVEEGITHNVSSQYYWRLVIAVGDNYIDLSKSDCAAGSLAPLPGDDIVQLGNRDDTLRQNAIILSTYGDDAPSIKQYAGIDSYSLSGKEVTVISRVLNSFKGRFVSTVSGEDFDGVLDRFRTDLDKVKEQTDREYTIWFYEYSPTLENEPASGWDDGDRADHEYDIFYNYAEGLAWRFMSDGEGGYFWKPITDQQTLAALEKAARAQDTADGKRRNFVAQPVPPYDEGDTWSNATYGTLYTNDDLVCISPKAEGETFSIDDWQPASDMNSGTKKMFESQIEQLDSRITLQVEGHDELAAEVTSLEVRLDAAEAEILIHAGRIDGLDGTVTDLGVRLDAAEGDITLYASQTAENTASISQLQIDVASITSTVTSVQGDLEEAEKTAAAAAKAAHDRADEAHTAAGNAQTTADAAEQQAKANATAITQNADSISAIAGLFDAEGHLLEGSGWVATSDFNALYTQVADMEGVLVTKAELSTSVQYDPDTGAVTSDIRLTADQISLEGITTINSSFKVDTDGNTYIGGFVVSGNGLTNRNSDGTFTNDAYVIFRNDEHGCFSGIGGNVLPASSGARGVARFENHDTSDWWGIGTNYAMLVSAQGASNNIAIAMNGGCVSGLALKTTVIGNAEKTRTLTRSDTHVICINDEECTVTLPAMQLYDDGHLIRIKWLGAKVKFKLSSCNTYGPEGSPYASLPCLIYDENSTLTGTDTLDDDTKNRGMDLVWVRDLQRTVGETTYYGAWIQYKTPRAW